MLRFHVLIASALACVLALAGPPAARAAPHGGGGHVAHGGGGHLAHGGGYGHYHGGGYGHYGHGYYGHNHNGWALSIGLGLGYGGYGYGGYGYGGVGPRTATLRGHPP